MLLCLVKITLDDKAELGEFTDEGGDRGSVQPGSTGELRTGDARHGVHQTQHGRKIVLTGGVPVVSKIGAGDRAPNAFIVQRRSHFAAS